MCCVQRGHQAVDEGIELGLGIGDVGGDRRLQPSHGAAECDRTARVGHGSRRCHGQLRRVVAIDECQAVQGDSHSAIVVDARLRADAGRQGIEGAVALVGEVCRQASGHARELVDLTKPDDRRVGFGDIALQPLRGIGTELTERSRDLVDPIGDALQRRQNLVSRRVVAGAHR